MNSTDPFFPCQKRIALKPPRRPPNNTEDIAYMGATLFQETYLRCMEAIISSGVYTKAKDLDSASAAKVTEAIAWISTTARAQALSSIAEMLK